MPYRKAWLWVLALLALTFVEFWPGYFSQLPAKKLAHHYHAASAVLWMILPSFGSADKRLSTIKVRYDPTYSSA